MSWCFPLFLPFCFSVKWQRGDLERICFNCDELKKELFKKIHVELSRSFLPAAIHPRQGEPTNCKFSWQLYTETCLPLYMDTKMYQYISNAIKRLARSPTHCTSERFVHILCIWWAQGTWVISAPYELTLCDTCDVVLQECVMLCYRSVWCCGTGVCVMLCGTGVCDVVVQECVWCCCYMSVWCCGIGVCVMLCYRSVCDVVLQECVWCCGTGVCVVQQPLCGGFCMWHWAAPLQHREVCIQGCISLSPPTALLVVLLFRAEPLSVPDQWLPLSTCRRSQLQQCSLCEVWLREVFVRLCITVWTPLYCWGSENSDNNNLLHLQPGLQWFSV